MAQLIKKYGFRLPILVDGADTLITGHLRREVGLTLGLKELPTILVDDLTEAQVKALMIADNRLAELATWDDRTLATQFLEIVRLEPDLDLELTGFDMGDIDFRIEGLSALGSDEPDPADLAPEPGPSVTEPGDIWQLGPHRVYCGNALDKDAYEALMGSERASAVFTDPPYNVPIDKNVSGLGRVKHHSFKMAVGELTEAEFIGFLTRSCKHLAHHSHRGALHFICMDWRHLGELLTAGGDAYAELVNMCVWVKHNAGMGSLYRSQHELVLVFKNGRGHHQNNVQLGKHGRNRTNVWQYPAINDFGRAGTEGNLLALHPTVKPVAMVADAIMDTTKLGEIVLDPFLGSGTTLIAAERTGRRAFGIEIDPVYVDVAVRRWQAWTRDVARHAASGLTFDEITENKEARRDR
jgi:hypothetical protein